MDDQLSRASFAGGSQSIERFLRNACAPEILDDWLITLVIYAGAADRMFSSVRGKIITAAHKTHGARISPWTDHPHLTTWMGTAHDCALGVMVVLLDMIGDAVPGLPNVNDAAVPMESALEILEAWIEGHRTVLIEKAAKISSQLDYPELLRLAAEIECERELTLASWPEEMKARHQRKTSTTIERDTKLLEEFRNSGTTNMSYFAGTKRMTRAAMSVALKRTEAENAKPKRAKR